MRCDGEPIRTSGKAYLVLLIMCLASSISVRWKYGSERDNTEELFALNREFVRCRRVVLHFLGRAAGMLIWSGLRGELVAPIQGTIKIFLRYDSLLSYTPRPIGCIPKNT